MTDDRRPDGSDGAEDEPEKDGLGLTEEFARIESEIEREMGGRGAAASDSEDEEKDEPVGQETGEWSLEANGEHGDVDGVHGDTVPDEPAEPADPHPGPPTQGGSLADQPADGLAEEAGGDPAEAEAEEPDAMQPVGEEPVVEDQPDAAEPKPEPPATEHTIVRPRPLAPRPPAAVAMGAGGGMLDDVDFDVKTPALWWRFLTGSVLIVAATATAIAVNILLFFGEVADGLNDFGDRVQRELDTIEAGDPQTILILGSDERSNTPGDPGRSDTTMLLRVDADNEVLSLFSLPRDLKVDIPGYGSGLKLNEAYTLGGVKTTVETVKKLLGININHVVNVDFQGFADAVSAIDCVYVDVDRDYFNDNSIPGQEQYAVIDVNAGYQRLCGQNALDYVRYRHADTDIVRAARQQDFLSQARKQVPPGEVLPILGGDLGSDLIDIFTKYTSSDISTTEDVLATLKAFIAVRNVPIKRVSFDGTLEESFVTATPEQIDKAVEEFLGGEDTSGPAGKAQRRGSSSNGGDRKEKQRSEPEPEPEEGDSSLISTEDASLAAPCFEAQDKYASYGRTSARRLRFPVYIPTAVMPGSCYDDGSRQYEITDPDDNRNSAYKLVIQYTTESTLPEYYGVEGTTWADPPILEDPSDTITVGDRSFDLYYDGDRLQRIAWHDAENNSYWLSNTLLGTLDEGDMLDIAKSMDEANG